MWIIFWKLRIIMPILNPLWKVAKIVSSQITYIRIKQFSRLSNSTRCMRSSPSYKPIYLRVLKRARLTVVHIIMPRKTRRRSFMKVVNSRPRLRSWSSIFLASRRLVRHWLLAFRVLTKNLFRGRILPCRKSIRTRSNITSPFINPMQLWRRASEVWSSLEDRVSIQTRVNLMVNRIRQMPLLRHTIKAGTASLSQPP